MERGGRDEGGAVDQASLQLVAPATGVAGVHLHDESPLIACILRSGEVRASKRLWSGCCMHRQQCPLSKSANELDGHIRHHRCAGTHPASGIVPRCADVCSPSIFSALLSHHLSSRQFRMGRNSTACTILLTFYRHLGSVEVHGDA